MGRKQTLETRRKISNSVKHFTERLKKDPEAWNEYRRKQAEGTQKRYTPAGKEERRKRFLMDTPFDDLGLDSKRDKILLDQNGKCGKCNLKEWFGTNLVLEIDHINGDHKDNLRENLIALCPNCHSITPTWRGKNKRSCNRVNDTIAIEALKTEPTIRQALIKCGLSPRGGNYKRFSRLKTLLEV
jgi:5-methylcytosine-specific restriction endonuclease McrA